MKNIFKKKPKQYYIHYVLRWDEKFIFDGGLYVTIEKGRIQPVTIENLRKQLREQFIKDHPDAKNVSEAIVTFIHEF